MTFISYAQNFEDVMLWRVLKEIKNGFYVDVGAWSPDIDSVTKLFYGNHWSGINIEPNPEFHALCSERRPRDLNLKLAVGDREGSIFINFMSNPRVSTAVDEFVEQHKSAGLTSNRREVPLTTLKAIFRKNIQSSQPIHFLKVDVQGLEEAVLRGNDWQNYRPWIVVVEAKRPMTQTDSYERWEPILFMANYSFAYADGLNRFYVAAEHKELIVTFKYPPNVFDDFVLNSQLQIEAKAQQAEIRAQQSVEKALQFEVKSQQAEALAHRYAAELLSVYKSTSWRIFAPLRWPVHQWRLLRQHGIKARIKAVIKKILLKLLIFVIARPTLKSLISRLVNRLGIAERIKPFVMKILQAPPEDPPLLTCLDSDRNNPGIYLDKRATRILSELKDAINGRDVQ
jgi:FkbM family methyltransferase